MFKSSFVLSVASLSLVVLGLSQPVWAESFASSASSAGSASSGSVSDSIKDSSNSSNSNRNVAEGPYRVMEVAEIDATPGQPARTQLTLRATDAGPLREFVLELPRVALADKPLAAGDLVQASQRPYGFEFARADNRQAFFLVLTDDWQREFDSKPVTL